MPNRNAKTGERLADKLRRARELTWERLGKHITFYLPGMFTLDGIGGRYPAASITGAECALSCDHCGGKILESMLRTDTPKRLVKTCLSLEAKGCKGVLLSGGCDAGGKLPWETFVDAVAEVKARTGLIVSVHCGLVDDAQAQALKAAGADQALIDVIGDDATFQRVYHVEFGVSRIRDAMGALATAGLPIVPHVVCGLNYGRMTGERTAVEMIAGFDVEQLVIVSLMNLSGTPMAKALPPAPEEVAELIADARLAMPDTRISLGCARKRGQSGLDVLAIDAGVDRMALPSDEAVVRAEGYGLDIRYQTTCCSVDVDLSASSWN